MEIIVLLFLNIYLILFLADKDNWGYIVELDIHKDEITSVYIYLKSKDVMNQNVINKLLYK